jgi:uncharacterized protein with HEPN domain
MSEASQRLSDPLKATGPEIEWRRISAFRNVQVYECLGVDLETIWEITQRDIPKLKRAVLAMLEG